AVSPSGRRLAAGGEDRVVRFVDEKGGLVSLGRHAAAVTGVAFVDEDRLVSAGRDGVVRVWDVAAKRELPAIEGHRGAVTRLAWTKDGARAVSAGLDGAIDVWDTTTWRLEETIVAARAAPIRALAVTRDGERVLVGLDDAFQVGALAKPGLASEVSQPAPMVAAVAEAGRFVTVSADKVLRFVSFEGVATPIDLPNARKDWAALAVRPDGGELLAAGASAFMRAAVPFDISTGRSNYAHP